MFQVLVPFVEKILLCAALSVIARRDEQRVIVLHVSESIEDLDELLSAALLFLLLSGLGKRSLGVAHERGSRSACEVSVDADPLGLELRLDKFEAVQGAHIGCGLTGQSRLASRRCCALVVLACWWLVSII